MQQSQSTHFFCVTSSIVFMYRQRGGICRNPKLRISFSSATRPSHPHLCSLLLRICSFTGPSPDHLITAPDLQLQLLVPLTSHALAQLQSPLRYSVQVSRTMRQQLLVIPNLPGIQVQFGQWFVTGPIPRNFGPTVYLENPSNMCPRHYVQFLVIAASHVSTMEHLISWSPGHETSNPFMACPKFVNKFGAIPTA